MHIALIGAGPGSDSLMTRQAEDCLRRCSAVFTTRRLHALLSHVRGDMRVAEVHELPQLLREAGGAADAGPIGVLLSGDVGFFSAAALLQRELPEAAFEWHCGVSSLQYLCAKACVPYDGVKAVSLHGRKGDIIAHVCYNRYVFALTGGENGAAQVLQTLTSSDLGDAEVTVGENLSMPDERISRGTAAELCKERFGALASLLVHNPHYRNPHAVLADADFERGDVPMTKAPVRALSLAALAVQPNETAYDVGAGTGAMAVSMARRAFEGSVYALEKEAAACALLAKNREKHGAYNMRIVQTCAPQGMDDLPAPDCAFIGGSGGQLEAIIGALQSQNPRVRIVINAISLQTLSRAIAALEGAGYSAHVSCANIAEAVRRGGHDLLLAQNPVYIISGVKP